VNTHQHTANLRRILADCLAVFADNCDCGQCGPCRTAANARAILTAKPAPVVVCIHVRGGVAYEPNCLPAGVQVKIVDHDNR
jgi:sugar/nucleoside kinase (ribokinase family)